MWVVAKVKNKNLKVFQNNFLKKIKSKTIFYEPKIVYEQIVKNKNIKKYKSLLENYVFCYNENFKNKTFYNNLKFIEGLEFFLDGHLYYQNEISNFIDYCKSFEDKNGFIKNTFFKNIVCNKAKFVSGPFMNMTFDIIEKQKNKLKISIGKFVTTIPDNKNYLYQPVWLNLNW